MRSLLSHQSSSVIFSPTCIAVYPSAASLLDHASFTNVITCNSDNDHDYSYAVKRKCDDQFYDEELFRQKSTAWIDDVHRME